MLRFIFKVDDPSKPLTNQGAGDVVCQKRRRPKSASSSYDESEISLVKLSSYDRNKRNNETSHIHMPTFESTVRSQDIDQEEDFSISSLSKFPVTDSKAPSSAGNELDAAETNQKQSSKEKKKGSSTSSGRRSSCSACGSVASMWKKKKSG